MITIRRARAEDAGELSQIAFSAKRHWGYPDLWMELWKPQLTFTPEYFDEYESWLAEQEGDPVAFYTLTENAGIAWIDNLWVKPSFIGQGLGRILFQHALTRANELGFHTLQLDADPNAVGFYERMGMHKIDEKHSEVAGQPRVLPIMEIRL